jgi:hypothetical protein
MYAFSYKEFPFIYENDYVWGKVRRKKRKNKLKMKK